MLWIPTSIFHRLSIWGSIHATICAMCVICFVWVYNIFFLFMSMPSMLLLFSRDFFSFAFVWTHNKLQLASCVMSHCVRYGEQKKIVFNGTLAYVQRTTNRQLIINNNKKLSKKNNSWWSVCVCVRLLACTHIRYKQQRPWMTNIFSFRPRRDRPMDLDERRRSARKHFRLFILCRQASTTSTALTLLTILHTYLMPRYQIPCPCPQPILK